MAKKLTMVLTPRDRHNIRRVIELTGISKSEAVRRALEQYRRTTEETITKEAERSVAAQALASGGGA
jgi:hypothetical protein